MANLAITTVCNQNCPYCFTVDYLNKAGRHRDFIDLEDFEKSLSFLERSGIDEIRLLGGEPTLHPQFVELIERARKTGKRIIVFSNGLMPKKVLFYLESLPVAECTILVNVNEPRTVKEELHKRRYMAIRRLGERVLLGFNIYQADFQLDFLLPMITEAGCKPAIRLGIAQPCLSGDNQYVHPNQYVAIGKKISRFARITAKAGVSLEFDCGFVRCMFSDTDLEILKTAGADVGWRCNPILDVSVEGQVIHCYPLSNLGSLPLTPETDAPALREAFASRTRLYRQAGIFRECSTCPFKIAGECPGGCLAVTIRRFRHTPFRLAIPYQEATL
ncbi:MAG: radical SAM protein [Anaerolineae bacterium]|nr:radical SAM protein [Anaerolineae bacterium]